jgi:oligopeptide transport system ATP-binding protein
MSINKKIPLIEVRDAKIVFGSGRKKVQAVKDVTFDIYQGETFGLVGESGSGKTTIGRAIVGIQPLSSGRIYFDNKLIRGKVPNLKRFAKSITLKINDLSQHFNITSNALDNYIDAFKTSYYKYLFNKNYNHKTGALSNISSENINHSSNKEEFAKHTITKTPIQYKIILSNLVNDIGVLNGIIETVEKAIRLVDHLYVFIKIDKVIVDKTVDDFKILLKDCHLIKDQLSNAYLALQDIAKCRVNAEKGKYANVKTFLTDIGNSIKIVTKCYNQVNIDVQKLIKLEKAFESLPMINEKISQSNYFTKPTRKEKYQLKRKIQMIFQDPASSLNERMSVEQIISEGLRNFNDAYLNDENRKDYIEHHHKSHDGKQIHVSEIDDHELRKFSVIKELKSVGLLQQHLGRYPHEFSGGQRQRIAIARSLILRPSFVVADEPISALDVSIRSQVLNLLKKIQKAHNLTYLFVAHDLTVVKVIADRVAVIYRGQIVELASSKELFKHPLHPYTKSLLSAVPIPNPKIEKNKTTIIYEPEKVHYDYLIHSPR